MAVLPSPESATEVPCSAVPTGLGPTAPVPTSFAPCCVHAATGLSDGPLKLRVNTHAAPTWLLSKAPPRMAVLPSADNVTERPCMAVPTASLPTSFGPCCTHSTTVPPRVKTSLRAKTQAAPTPLLSPGAPSMAVLPSADRVTTPCAAAPTEPLPTSLGPCSVHTPFWRTKIQAAPMPLLSPVPPTTATLPSADSATAPPCQA